MKRIFKVLVILLAFQYGFSNPINLANPDENSGQFEGDIVLTNEQLVSGRTGLINTFYRWPSNTIPYIIEGFTSAYQTTILQAMAEISAYTCIKFVARTTQTDYIRITNANSGCWSYVGKIGGAQVVNLQASGGCASKGISMHELIHAIGFYHAQSDSNRDKYVTINYGNIISGQEHNFNYYTNSYVTDFGQGYDYGSIMHYSAYSFSKNGLPTITPLQSGVSIGQRNAMSAKDIAKINLMYSCSSTATTTTKATTTTPKPTTTTTTTKAASTTSTTKAASTTSTTKAGGATTLIWNRLP